MENIVDSVVVGAGIAGLSAALFLGRAGRSTIVYSGGKPRIFAVERVREYSGFDGVPTEEVLHAARMEVVRYGVEIREQLVQEIIPREDGLFSVQARNGTTVIARTVVLATGVVDELPPLTGLPPAWGRDVRVCPCFDGHEVQGQRFVVFGVPERLAHSASWVSMWSDKVTVVTPHALSEDDMARLALLKIPLVHDEVTGLVHQGDTLVALSTKGGMEVDCDAAWISANIKAASPLAASLCDVDAAGLAMTDKGGRTSRPGVFAIGNANEAWAHMAHAAAAGTTVGPIVTMYLLEQRLAQLRLAAQ
jgi:thioredoxin reductase